MNQFNSLLWRWRNSDLLLRLQMLLKTFLFFFILMSTHFKMNAQGVVPTKGTDFWIAVPYHPAASTTRCDVFIASDVNTSGTISIPAQGWTQAFTVVANVTTSISLPLNLVENVGSDIVELRGVQILSVDTVSVFAIVIQQYSSDATVVYPKPSLGVDYMISSYQGIANSPNSVLKSQIQIVATEDGTQVRVVPKVDTEGGFLAGAPYIVNLNRGETYQIKAKTALGDLSGTTITGTDSSGPCRPFAVFSGTSCTYIPSTCTACDIIYDQALPVNAWGSTYYVVPFGNTSYTLKLMAEQNNTVYTMNGVSDTLNAGEVMEQNHITSTLCIQSNKPICATQYMQGKTCNGSGDPSMMYLNSEDQKIDKITFSTVTSAIINNHNIIVIMNTAHINQLKLDGVPVPASAFSTFSFCNNVSYATLPLTQGSHTITSDSGFTGYAYGEGGYESYAYSVGSFKRSDPILVDSVLCTADSLNIGTALPLLGSWWSTLTNPNDTIGFGQVLTLTPPIIPDIYIQHGSAVYSGCESTFYFDVSVPAPPQINISLISPTACVGQKVKINASTIPASSNFQYNWITTTGMNQTNIPNPTVTVTASQWYVVAVSSITGCSPTVYDSVFIKVYNFPLPNISAGGNQILCGGDSIQLQATGGTSYIWSTGDSSAGIVVYPLANTNYIVYGTDTNGCSNFDTVDVRIYPPPHLNLGSDIFICNHDSVILAGPPGFINYNWVNTGVTNDTLVDFPIINTSYILEVVDSNTCKISDTIIVLIRPPVLADAGPNQQTTCVGLTTTLVASGGNNYSWSPGGMNTATVSVSPITTTNYIVVVTDSNGCKNSDSVLVMVNPLITGTTFNQEVCWGDSITLSDSVAVTYLWQPGGATSATITVSPLLSSTYFVFLELSNGCLIHDTLQVDVNPLPLANAGPDQEMCIGESATMQASGGATYWWPGVGSASSNPIVTPLSSGYFLVEVTDSLGCHQSDSMHIQVFDLPIPNAGADQFICKGNSVVLQATGGVQYSWSPGGIQGAQCTVQPATATNYFVAVTDTNGCVAKDTVTITPVSPIVNFKIDDPICVTDDLSFINTSTIIGGVIQKSKWTFGDGTSSNLMHPHHNYATFGNFPISLIVESNLGCIDSLFTSLYINENPVANFTSINGCAKQPLLFTDGSVIGNGSIQGWIWDFGDGFFGSEQNPQHAFESDGFYSVQLTAVSDSGCRNTILISNVVEVYSLPEANFSATPWEASIFTPQIKFTDESVGAIQWQWNFDDGIGQSTIPSPTYNYSNLGHFNVELVVMNNLGCFDTIYKEVIISPDLFIYIPNAFTPNNDGYNDFFSPSGIGFANMNISIFNRWGEEVFSGNSLSEGWDGKDRKGDQYCNEGAYVYKVKVVDYFNTPHEYSGVVTLLR